MPYASRRQQRAFFAGAIPGIDKEKALEFAHETPNIKDLPERAPAEKGKPTLRSKEAALNIAGGLRRAGELVTGSRAKQLGNQALKHHRKSQNIEWEVAKRISERQASKGKARDAMREVRANMDRMNLSRMHARQGSAMEGAAKAEGKKVLATRVGLGAGAVGAATVPTARENPPTQPMQEPKIAAAFGEALRGIEADFAVVLKSAALGQINTAVSKGVGQFKGLMTSNALKAPGATAAVNQAIRPGRAIVNAMNVTKPH